MTRAGASVLRGFGAASVYGQFLLDPIESGRRAHRRHGAVFALDPPIRRRRRARRAVFVASEEWAEVVLEHPERFPSMGLSLVRGPPGSSQRRLRDGIIRMSGEQQSALRRAYAPCLARNRIAASESRLAEIAAEEIGSWPANRPFDVSGSLKRLVRRAATAVLFGAPDDPQLLGIADLIERHAGLQYSTGAMIFRGRLPGLPYARLLRHAESTEEALIEWLRSRECGADDLGGRINSVRDAHGEPLDARARAAQLWTLYGASFHTTASALQWVLLHMCWNPNIAQHLREEVCSSGTKSAYLDAVINEALRMSPPVAYQGRRVAEQDSLSGIPVEKGDRVFLNAFVLNRSAELYHQPDAFQPERWLTMTSTGFRPLAFSAGPRRCLGYTFAIAVMKHALAEIWREWSISLTPRARIGLRVAITQAPLMVPIVASRSGGNVDPCRFSGAASRQMAMA